MVGTEQPTKELTARQTQCLALAAEGFANKQIAHTLKISMETVREHLREARRKLNSRNTAQAVAQFERRKR